MNGKPITSYPYCCASYASDKLRTIEKRYEGETVRLAPHDQRVSTETIQYLESARQYSEYAVAGCHLCKHRLVCLVYPTAKVLFSMIKRYAPQI